MWAVSWSYVKIWRWNLGSLYMSPWWTHPGMGIRSFFMVPKIKDLTSVGVIEVIALLRWTKRFQTPLDWVSTIWRHNRDNDGSDLISSWNMGISSLSQRPRRNSSRDEFHLGCISRVCHVNGDVYLTVDRDRIPSRDAFHPVVNALCLFLFLVISCLHVKISRRN